MKGLVLCAPLFIAGCAIPSKIILPGGDSGFAIRCPNPAMCYNKAAEVCAPKTYQLLDKDASVVGGFSGNSMYSSGFMGSQTNLIVRCVTK